MSAPPTSDPAPFREPARDVPTAAEVDVLVAGGGPAGIAAAIAAARTGARTVLLEAHGFLGGVWTAALLGWIIDAADKPGIMAEIVRELDARGARSRSPHGGSDFGYDPEILKVVLEEMALGAGVRLRLHTRVCAAACDPSGRLAVVLSESKSGREAWSARCFVDATGDGDLAAQAGCGYDLGRPGSGECQPMSLLGVVAGLRADEIRPFVGGGARAPKERLLAELRRAGATPSYTMPTLFPIYDDLFAFVGNHEYGVSALDADAITLATVRARGETQRLLEALRGLGPPWARLRLVATGAQIGVREARRIHGRYTVTAEDLRTGARHPDAVCRVNFHIDVHTTRADGNGAYDSANRLPTRPYDIPLRALVARDVDGLLLAGRCISGDFLAHASYRVTGNAVALGQAAGATAALAAKTGILPHDLPWNAVAAALETLHAPVSV